MLSFDITDEAAMLALGGQLAKATSPGTIIFLYGDLGAGKTTLTRGFLLALGHTGIVKSPTYTLVESYQTSSQLIYHFDLYRLKDPVELEYLGIREYFHSQAICIVEWPENGGDILPIPDIVCYIKINNHTRQLRFLTRTLRGGQIIQQLKGG